eukprot:3390251-Amphidinium_carterae.1
MLVLLNHSSSLTFGSGSSSNCQVMIPSMASRVMPGGLFVVQTCEGVQIHQQLRSSSLQIKALVDLHGYAVLNKGGFVEGSVFTREVIKLVQTGQQPGVKATTRALIGVAGEEVTKIELEWHRELEPFLFEDSAAKFNVCSLVPSAHVSVNHHCWN